MSRTEGKTIHYQAKSAEWRIQILHVCIWPYDMLKNIINKKNVNYFLN